MHVLSLHVHNQSNKVLFSPLVYMLIEGDFMSTLPIIKFQILSIWSGTYGLNKFLLNEYRSQICFIIHLNIRFQVVTIYLLELALKVNHPKIQDKVLNSLKQYSKSLKVYPYDLLQTHVLSLSIMQSYSPTSSDYQINRHFMNSLSIFIAFSSVFLSYCSLNFITELIVYVSVCPLESEFLKELCRNHFLPPEYLVSFSSGKCAEVKCLWVTVFFSWAAITNHHKLRGLKEQNLFFHISGVKVLAGPYP